MLNQGGEQFEFCGGQIQSSAADGDFVIPLVHAELIHHQNRRAPDGPQPSEQVLHAQNQLPWAERFGEIVVHSKFKTGDPVRDLGPGRENQDRNIRGI